MLQIQNNFNAHRLRIDWDKTNKKQVEEAKIHYLKAKKEGRQILTESGKEVLAFRSDFETLIVTEKKLDTDQFALHILDETGDRRLIWNASCPDEIKEAQDTFNKYIKKGWKAYGVREDGKRSNRIRKFDPSTEEVFFDDKPNSIGERFTAFVEKFKEVKMLPSTRPG